MKLPNRENVFVPLAKLRDYLLSETHTDGRSKARFFRAVGFDEASVDLFAQSLLNIAHDENVIGIVTSRHGVKYVIDGRLHTPSGSFVRVRTIWIVDAGQDKPRFVTAYPTK